MSTWIMERVILNAAIGKSQGVRGNCLVDFSNPKDFHDFTEYSDGLEMQEQDNLTDGDDGHLVDVGSGMMQRSRKSSFVPSLSSWIGI